jgi:hypothetical protein
MHGAALAGEVLTKLGDLPKRYGLDASDIQRLAVSLRRERSHLPTRPAAHGGQHPPADSSAISFA